MNSKRTKHVTSTQIAALKKAVHELDSITSLFQDKELKELFVQAGGMKKSQQTHFFKEALKGNVDALTLELLHFASAMYVAYQAAMEPDEKASRVVIRSARDLSEEEKNKITTKFRSKHGEKTEIAFEVDPSLIGGLQIYENNEFSDLSVRSSLDSLEHSML